MRNIERTDTDPYDIPENKEMDFEVEVSYIMKKNTILSSKDYIEEIWCDEERDYDGSIVKTGGKEIITDNIDWVDEFNRQEYDPVLLLKEYQGVLLKEIRGLQELEQTISVKYKIAILRDKVAACDWDYEDIEIKEI